jgi:hypothetical protein
VGPETHIPTLRVPEIIPVTTSVTIELAEVKKPENIQGVTEETVADWLSVYVPAPPFVFVPTAIIRVPVGTFGPPITVPNAREPDAIDVTVSVEPEIEPVKGEKAGTAGIIIPFTVAAVAESPTAIPG